MIRRFVVSDIHGEWHRLLKVLKLAKYNPEIDKLYLLGDYVDRGTDSKKTVEIVMNLVKDGAIALKGNHDQMMVDAIDEYNELNEFMYIYNSRFTSMYQWVINGGNKTLKDYGKHIPYDHIDFLRNLPTMVELDNYILVHAGINPLVPLHEQSEDDLLWIRQDFYENYNGDKIVVFGHTPVVNITGKEIFKPFFRENIIGIDTCAAYGGKLTLMELDTFKIYQA